MAFLPGPPVLARLLARARSWIGGIAHRDAVEAEMTEEFRHHIELRTRDLVQGGMTPREASRRAHVEFGHVETHKQSARAARGLHRVDQLRFSWLDVKLGVRMVVKHPGLTVVAVIALAAGIPVGLAPVHLADALEAPLPEDEDNRLRAIRLWDPSGSSVARPTARDAQYWRHRLSSFAALGAFRPSSYNLASEDGRAAAVSGAEVSPSVFDMLGTAPLVGRTFLPGESAPAASDVVVLGHDVWQSRFGADPGVLGTSVEVAGAPHTVVGVMPPGFYFPIRQQLWLPLEETGAGDGSVSVGVVGLLAEGMTAEQAQSELTAVGSAEPVDASSERAELQAEVVPFALTYVGIPKGGLDAVPQFFYFRVLALVLLMVACANVAMLIFARTATRYRELAIRTALGASRVRVASQLFVEALVLSLGAAGIGIALVDQLLGVAFDRAPVPTPYWLTLSVTGDAVIRAMGLAVLSATVAGVVPALRITGKKVQRNMQQVGAAASGLRFGNMTGTLIVLDVAVSVAAIGFALGLSRMLTDVTSMGDRVGIPAEEYLAAELRRPVVDDGTAAGTDEHPLESRLAATQQLLVERLEAEPGVRSVTIAEALPRMDHPSRRVTVEGDLDGGEEARWLRAVRVEPGFFRALDHTVRSGRDFEPVDVAGGVPPVIVNDVFVDRILGGRDAIGRRLRFVPPRPRPEDEPWHDIIGVVGHLGVSIVNPLGSPAIYVPAAPGQIHPMQIGVHLRGDPRDFAPRLRDLAGEVDPALVLGTPVVLSNVYQGDWYLAMAVAGGLALLVGILVALAASGLYAIVSYSVSQRTREIGVRSALGAGRASLVLAISRRALGQIGLGALLGAPIAARVFFEFREDLNRGESATVAILMALATAVAIVGVIALTSCVAPARRALKIEPSAALRADG